ncbi:cation diffusion facilitator family transporter, partial [Jatrophihabitans sp.]|uniref:cation diffusion facilitator family transporter n=1 Tax=Jatrophihabitans sp. TaxID=1932789 RepID=UPI0030C778F2|nr:putative cation efflux system protein [Jatrophihabitans sp.]
PVGESARAPRRAMCDSGQVSHDHGAGHGGHSHAPSATADRRWLAAALAVVVVFMAGEVVAGLVAHSIALITDAGHMLSDATAIMVAIVASRIAQRPAKGAYTYGFARVDALSGQASGITLLLLSAWFGVVAVRRLIDPSEVRGGVVTIVALVGVVTNIAATALAGRADRGSLNVRGVVAHLATDVWAFGATAVAGIVVLTTGWDRADAVASLVVAVVMVWTGWRLVRAAGRVFLEAAPQGVDPHLLGAELAGVDGVAQLHDLHVWQIGPGSSAMSAHLLVRPSHDCHEVSARVRTVLDQRYGIGHVTLQTEHADAPTHDAGDCADVHGEVHTSPGS